MIIDAHAHIGKLENTKFADDFEKNRGFLLAEMETSGTHRALVIANSMDFGPNNEMLQDLLSGYKNLHAVAAAHIKDGKCHNLDQLESYLKGMWIVGVKLYPGYWHFYPGDAACRPVYELCAKYGVPVIFHSGDTLNNYDMRGKVKYSHPLHIDEVAVDYPTLKIVVAHLGNPWLDDCAELLYKNENVFADLSGLIVGDSFEGDYGELMRRRINDLIAYSSEDKLLYGTDWPLAPMGEYQKFVQSLRISSAGFEKVFHRNAIELFKLPRA